MALERTTLQAKAAIERRPAAATTQRRAVAAAPSPARVLQQRLGNQGIQALLSRRLPAAQPTTGTAPSMASIAVERPSASVPAQVPKSDVTSEKETSSPSASKVFTPSSKAPPSSPSSAPGSPPSTGKPAAGPAIEGTGKATTAPGTAK